MMFLLKVIIVLGATSTALVVTATVEDGCRFLLHTLYKLEANAGVLTNFEVLDFLKSRGAGKDPTRLTATVALIEFKQSAVSNLTRENVIEFMETCKNYKLAKADILNIINILPSSCVEIDPDSNMHSLLT
ncbi:G-protein coupled receptor [Lithospermum erythrorhizon]|uniref:G-protein coupled receptor n=1 Tax=Lithospermum erythrorhizon TaxID=34254 RepID=A0AAV3NZG0_LITER